MNDRINRNQYCASTEYMKRKYGISFEVLPVIFGDFIGESRIGLNLTDCVNNDLNVESFVKGLKINSLINCKIGKSVSTLIESSQYKEIISVKCTDFYSIEDRVIPGNIDIYVSDIDLLINIKIQKVSLSWSDELEFIPGNNYNVINLQ